jgi:hypothetical protein
VAKKNQRRNEVSSEGKDFRAASEPIISSGVELTPEQLAELSKPGNIVIMGEPPEFRIPTPATTGPFSVSPAFGFLFARRGDGTHGLYRLVVDRDGVVLEMKQLLNAPTRTAIGAMVKALRKLILDGTFRTGVIAEESEAAA